MGNNNRYANVVRHPNYIKAVEDNRNRQLLIGIDNEKKYNRSPNLCKACQTPILYKKRRNSFCTKSCFASYNNVQRGPLSLETRKKIGSSRKKGRKPKPKRFCKRCNLVEMINTKKTICDSCKLIYYENYLPNCKFDFDIRLYPEVFNLSLVERFGWYSPTNKGNNLKGVSRDHKFSVRDGFINKVDPNVMKHPANCELMVHLDNQRKSRKSSITLNELKNLIDKWAYD